MRTEAQRIADLHQTLLTATEYLGQRVLVAVRHHDMEVAVIAALMTAFCEGVEALDTCMPYAGLEDDADAD